MPGERISWGAQALWQQLSPLLPGIAVEVLARTERFVATVSQVTGHYHAPLLRADLRHAGGYAVRLRGVTVAEGPAGAKGGTP